VVCVENELSTHPVYDHIAKRLTKFINGIENQNTRNQILETPIGKALIRGNWMAIKQDINKTQAH
jgi:hypothetical protein